MENLEKEYQSLLLSQNFDETKLDYSLLEYHKTMLSHLAKVSYSGITIFDMHKMEHVYTSLNFGDLFGQYKEGLHELIHSEDLPYLYRNGILALKFLFQEKENAEEYKMITEFRIKSTSNKYIRVIEQYSLLEKCPNNNIWLALSVLDVSPDQTVFRNVKCTFMNIKKNRVIPIETISNKPAPHLTPREIDVLLLIKDGLFSKEISENLFLSINTVNTHRQRILEKLDVNNSIEAVNYASALGLI